MHSLQYPSGSAGSVTPALEGAPRSASHGDRMRSVIAPPPKGKPGEEGTPSKA